MAVFVAISVGAVLAYIELRSRLQSRPTVRGFAWAWWAARLTLEAFVALIGVAVLHSLDLPRIHGRIPEWLHDGIVGGIGGPALVRLTFFTYGRGEHATPVGLSTFYDPMRGFIEERLDDVGATQQSAWLHDKVIPGLLARGLGVEAFAVRYRDYVQGLTGMSDVNKLEEVEFVDGVLNDQVGEREKLEAIVSRAANLGAYRLLEELVDALK